MPPERAGTYVLILHLPRQATIDVGRLGRFQFQDGWYAYVGSARGSGGLAVRISRHRRSSKSLHWHVDYLRVHARPVAVWYAVGDQKRECAWAEALLRFLGASVPAPRFGASDCRCPTHLIHFDAPPDLSVFVCAVDESISEERFNA
jgi:Uri superfamily endonuclease